MASMEEFQSKSHCWPKRTQSLISHLAKISWLSPRLLGKYSVDWGDKSWTFWKVCVPLHHWWNHEFCTLSENPEGECPAVSLWPQAQAHFGYAQGLICAGTPPKSNPAPHFGGSPSSRANERLLCWPIVCIYEKSSIMTKLAAHLK